MKSRIFNLLMLAASLAVTIAFITVAPDTVPVHFGIDGAADRWGSKYEMLILPGALLLTWLLGEFTLLGFRKIAEAAEDGKKKSDSESNIKVLNIIFPVISAFFLVINCFSLYQSYSQLEGISLLEIRFEKIITALLGVLFIVMGNYMTKTRRNSVLGFRHIWTVYSDVTWRKSNRFAGYVSVVTGFINLILGIVLPRMLPVIVLIATLILSVAIMMIYAYKIYMEERIKDK